MPETQQTQIVYFAYGSNMSSPRLQARIRSATAWCRARLFGHQLRFHKHSLVDGSAKCDAYATGNERDVVWGVLFYFDAIEKSLLDSIEGVGAGYQSRVVEVITETASVIEAHTYVATLINTELHPYDWYKAHVIHGAREHQLPEDYIASIEAVRAIQDPDTFRCRCELSVYPGS